MTWTDRLVLVIAISGVALLYPWLWDGREGEAETVRIWAGDSEYARYPLDRPRTVEVPGPLGTTVVEIADGGARVVSDPGPRQICVRAGRLDTPGDQALCLPNRVAVEILGAEPRYDTIHY
ncbi:NusG domain II-containing protein [Alkalilimnicola ehrlichii MLHE-1]|uniref:Uncharacterized protein n=1 Tax=Alkalilimnicola ehrlichii (strain ATCC BAA-1101 / DSM 17681 / MLHE-1) TaxID=187272 RepID=Q0ABT0_ALKEH|nr:NusG domain II-containing protein [Alkalilimnicola ehrlichii]ABI55707.1 conserved hypothetical protein [Alkalilimnicola ehrlichii MLHE-1]